MERFEIEQRDDIAVLWLDRPPVNALDLEFLNELVEVLRNIQQSAARAVVLSARGKVFSAGADLVRVLSEGEQYVRESVAALSRAFGALFTFPRPVVAAVNGHAIAGGAILACACDYKIMAERGTIGVSELRVGVPFPLYGLEIVRFAVAPQHIQDVILRAETYSSQDGLALGFVDEVVASDVLLDRALEIARQLAAVPAGTFRRMKEALRAPTVRTVSEQGAAHDRVSADLWVSEEVRTAIQRFLEHTFRRR